MGSEKPLSDINFFICSTYVDLKQHREAVINTIRSHAGVINAQEFFGARDQKPLATCLEEVDKADVFLLFLGHRYGTADPESKKSFVECEYERATALKLPKFVYVMSDDYPFPYTHASFHDEKTKLDDFKARITKDLTVDFFTTPDDLAKKVYADLVRSLPDKGFKLGLDQAKASLPTPHEVLRDFNLLPKLNHGRQLELRVKFSDPMRASEDECEAFGYSYGSTLKRTIKVTDKALQDMVGWLAVFAEDDDALQLQKVASGSEVSIVAKTIQGEYTRSEPVYGFRVEPHPYMANVILGSSMDRTRVVVGRNTTSHMLCGLQFVEAMAK